MALGDFEQLFHVGVRREVVVVQAVDERQNPVQRDLLQEPGVRPRRSFISSLPWTLQAYGPMS